MKHSTASKTKPAMSAALQAALTEARNAPITSKVWKPTPENSEIFGRILSYGPQTGKYGLAHVLMLDTPDGPQLVFCNIVLAGEIERHECKVGDDVAIVYRGETPSVKGHPTKLYSLAKVSE
jgi:hypothetical protein